MPHEHVKPCRGVGSRPTPPEDGSTAAGPLGLCCLVGTPQPGPGVHFPAPLAPLTQHMPAPVPCSGGALQMEERCSGAPQAQPHPPGGPGAWSSPCWPPLRRRWERCLQAPSCALRAPCAFFPQGTAAGLGSGLAGERVCELRVHCSSTHAGSGVSRCAQPFLCNLLKCHVV